MSPRTFVPFALRVCCKCYASRTSEVIVLLYCPLNCSCFPIVHPQIINNNTLYRSLCVSRVVFVLDCAGHLFKFLHRSSIFFTIHSTPFSTELSSSISTIFRPLSFATTLRRERSSFQLQDVFNHVHYLLLGYRTPLDHKQRPHDSW